MKLHFCAQIKRNNLSNAFNLEPVYWNLFPFQNMMIKLYSLLHFSKWNWVIPWQLVSIIGVKLNSFDSCWFSFIGFLWVNSFQWPYCSQCFNHLTACTCIHKMSVDGMERQKEKSPHYEENNLNVVRFLFFFTSDSVSQIPYDNLNRQKTSIIYCHLFMDHTHVLRFYINSNSQHWPP